MRVELGNDQPLYNPTGGPVVTYVTIPDSYTVDPGANVGDLSDHLVANPDVTNLPEQEAFVSITHPGAGTWVNHAVAGSKPSWVWSDNDEFAQMLAEHYGCPVGRPDDVEDTHYTHSGPAGVTPQLTVVPDGEDQPNEGQ